jgi:hypothetical protein
MQLLLTAIFFKHLSWVSLQPYVAHVVEPASYTPTAFKCLDMRELEVIGSALLKLESPVGVRHCVDR